MGKFEDNLIILILMYILRWFFSNERNREAFMRREIRMATNRISNKKKESEQK